MNSQTGRYVAQKEFKRLIFSDTPIILQKCTSFFHDLGRDVNQVSRILSDPTVSVMFLSNFDKYAERISDFFSHLDGGLASEQVNKNLYDGTGLPDALVSGFLLRLLDDQFGQFQAKPSFHQLFGSIVNFCLTFHSAQLGVLATELGEKEHLLELLVSGENSGQVMRKWIHAFNTTSPLFKSNVFEAWVKRFVALCGRCQGNHFVSEQFGTWQKLQGLIVRLADAVDTFTSTSEEARDVVTQEDKKLLGNFGIGPPASERALRNVLEQLRRDETVKVLRVLADSFPCRPCYQASMGDSLVEDIAEEVQEEFPPKEQRTTGPVSFTGLFGANLGTWRVCLSAQALKDLTKSRSEGDFHQIQLKLEQLASGDWRRKSLAQPAGDYNERKECQGILSNAVYARNGRILWQVDVEFNEGSRDVEQLVKVWKIGGVEEVSDYIRNVLRILRTYSTERVEACKRVILDGQGVYNIPSSFNKPVLARTGGTVELPRGFSIARVLEELIESNKFYMATQTVIENIASQNLAAVFPFVPSEEELRIIKNYQTSTLILGRSGTGKTTCLVYKLVGRYLAYESGYYRRQRRQVLLTRSSLLSEKLALYTKALLATHLNKPSSTTTDEVSKKPSEVLAEKDKEVKLSIFCLKGEDFPLVCTFGQFMKILENSVKSVNRDFSPSWQQNRRSGPASKRARKLRLFRPPKVVDFAVFSQDYWPKFTRTKIPAAQAFVEIIGVVKGSATRHSSSPAFRPLSREEYQEIGHRISPADIDRERLYDLYERYEKLKRDFGDQDDVDRAISVLNALSGDEGLRWRIASAFDEVYVDEIQDQRLLEIEMLLQIIKSPRAIHFAGDTAQCISKDSAFRFQNVKRLIFEHFRDLSQAANSPELARPKLCPLVKNYRTHQGILSLASHVMRILRENFPRTVDILPDEFGQFSGPKPIVFVGFNEEVFSSRVAAMSGHGAQSSTQFGDKQVIIVRDTASKPRLKAAIGDFALILTIIESKGMEFEDVLLYDFFSTSECISAFRALGDSKTIDERHIALCSELKQLYVAITRAQIRLWIFESNEIELGSVLKLWTAQENPLVEIAYASDRDIDTKLAQLRPDSTAPSANWSEKGHEFIRRKDYENALFCFTRAGDKEGATLAHAHIQEALGDCNMDCNPSIAERALLEAVKLFRGCRLPIREASCHEKLANFETAAGIFSEVGEHGRSAELFDRAGLFEKAANAYSNDGQYNEGASVLARENLFHELVTYLKRCGNSLNHKERLHYYRLCYLSLRVKNISFELRGDIEDGLGTDIEKEEFYLQYRMLDELLTLYFRLGEYGKAVGTLEEEGYPDKAWQVITEHVDFFLLRRQPLDREVRIRNYARARDFLAILGTFPKNAFLSSTRGSGGPDPWPAGSFWGGLAPTVQELFHHQISYGSINWTEKWMKQFFDITVTFRSKDFTNIAETIAHLPIESIAEILEIVNRTDFMKGTCIPEAFLMFLRVFPIPHRGSYAILESSPLLAGAESSPQTWDTARTSQEIARWTLRQISKSVTQVQEKANHLYEKRYPSRCPRFLASERCRMFRALACDLSHDRVTLQEYTTEIEDLLRVNSLYFTLLELFNRLRRLYDTAYLESLFKGLRLQSRRWAERLLHATIYVSALENAPAILVRSRARISEGNTQYFQVARGLQDLLFHKLKTEWNRMCDFSSVLEQLQVAETLGIKPHLWLGKAQGSCTRHKMLVVERFKQALSQDICESCVRELDSVLEAVKPLELQSFHAVVLVYEQAATYLIRMCHKSGFLLPAGWVEMYLLQDSRLSPTGAHRLDPALTQSRRKALLSLTRSFCRLIDKIEGARGFGHKLSGSFFPWQRLVRRNVDFLLTCLLNASSWKGEVPSEYATTEGDVKKALQTKFAGFPRIIHFQDENRLAMEFNQSFGHCAGKDSLRIIKEGGESTPYFSFLEPGVPAIQLDSLSISIKSGHDERLEPVHRKREEKEVMAAALIQRNWRIRYPIIHARREFFKTPRGREIIYIGRLCNGVIERQSIHPREVIARRAVLFGHGPYLYRLCGKTKKRFSEVKRVLGARHRENVGNQSVKQAFQLQLNILFDMSKLTQAARILDQKNWENLHVSAGVLVEKINDALETLGVINARLDMIMVKQLKIARASEFLIVWN